MTSPLAYASSTMPSSSVATGEIKKSTDLKPRALWELEINESEKAMRDFLRRAKEADARFKDERSSINANNRFFNIYFANTNIMESALYAQTPKPSVSRRYADYKDNTARVAALIMQRSLQQDLNDPEDDFDQVMRQCVQDRLIPGLSVAWLRLETDTEDIPAPAEAANDSSPSLSEDPPNPDPQAPNDGFPLTEVDPATGEAIPQQRITSQRVAIDYVHWQDFRFSPCRTWAERRWVGRAVFMTYEELVKRFGKAKADLTQLDHRFVGTEGDSDYSALSGKEVYMKAVVYEIWDRTTRKVHWYAPSYAPDLLDTRDDFLGLQSFEPCPRPMLANITTTSTIPRPDYYMLQDQYTELNTVNARISLLVQACKVVGVYDQSAKSLGALLTGNENTMVPVPDWGAFAEKGGVKGAVDWIPLEMVVAALQRLYEAREAIKGQIYELSGIADIVRGDSKASETLGAQKIKAQFASIRIKKLQNEVARFASDILRIKAEIQVKHFEPITLIERSGIVFTDNDEWVPQAVALLKSEKGFKWRVEIQSDSMAQADYDEEKKDRIEFMSAVTGYMSQALPMAGQIPELKPVILGTLKWGMAAFKGADDITGMIDKQLTLLEGKPPEPPKPDPAEIKAKMQMQLDQQKGQREDAKMQAEMSRDQQMAQLEQQRMQAELQFKEREAQLEEQRMQMELEFKQQEMALKQQANEQNLQATMQKNQIDLQTHQQVSQQKAQDAMMQSNLAAQKGQQELQFSEQQHEQGLEQGEQQAAAKVQQMKAQAAAKPKPKKE